MSKVVAFQAILYYFGYFRSIFPVVVVIVVIFGPFRPSWDIFGDFLCFFVSVCNLCVILGLFVIILVLD